jgi:hypothetical protein
VKTDLTVLLSDRPGAVAELGEALGKNGVNLEGFFGFVLNNTGWAHLLIDQSHAHAAREALMGIADVAVQTDVLVLEMEDRPGEMGRICRRIADSGVNLKFAYLAAGTRLVVAPDDLVRARGAIELAVV